MEATALGVDVVHINKSCVAADADAQAAIPPCGPPVSAHPRMPAHNCVMGAWRERYKKIWQHQQQPRRDNWQPSLPPKEIPNARQKEVTKEKSLIDQYKPTLMMFFNWRDDLIRKYNNHMSFVNNRLYSVKPEQIFLIYVGPQTATLWISYGHPACNKRASILSELHFIITLIVI